MVAVNYFTDLFSSTVTAEFEEFLEEVPTLITDKMNEELTVMKMKEEVRRALFMMHPEKASGPDRMPALFYQQAWLTIKKDILELVNDFFMRDYIRQIYA